MANSRGINDTRSLLAAFAGFDCDDDGLNTAVEKAGHQAFLFGSDFPPEVFDAAKFRHEIDALLKRTDLTKEDKEAVLGGNAVSFYGSALQQDPLL